MSLEEEVKLYPCNYIHGKDCSEYAEDIQEALRLGTIVTFDNPKPLTFFGTEDKFLYHTVLKVGDYIVDLTSPNKVYPLNTFCTMMGTDFHTGYFEHF